jgi:hypothetical protein
MSQPYTISEIAVFDSILKNVRFNVTHLLTYGCEWHIRNGKECMIMDKEYMRKKRSYEKKIRNSIVEKWCEIMYQFEKESKFHHGIDVNEDKYWKSIEILSNKLIDNIESSANVTDVDKVRNTIDEKIDDYLFQKYKLEYEQEKPQSYRLKPENISCGDIKAAGYAKKGTIAPLIDIRYQTPICETISKSTNAKHQTSKFKGSLFYYST